MVLPACPARFSAKKAAILAQLAQPEGQYADASPKGAVDEGVRPLLEVINSIDGFVTTSSCAGRVAVFLEGRRGGNGGSGSDGEPSALAVPAMTAASAGGKGGGGNWLFVSHDPLLGDENGKPANYGGTDWTSRFGLAAHDATAEQSDGNSDPRLVHFKFEPMILHVLTASLAHAQLLLRCALAAGFRESGAVSIGPTATTGSAGDADNHEGPMPMVAVRSMGLGLESVIGISEGTDEGEDARCIVAPRYLARLALVADQRFVVNRERTARFQAALTAATEQEQQRQSVSSHPAGWEDAEARRARKRAEGLQRQAAQSQKKEAIEEKEPTDAAADVYFIE